MAETAAKKTAAKKTAAKKTTKKAAPKKAATKKTTVKAEIADTEVTVTLQGRIEDVRKEAEARINEIRETVEDAVEEVRSISLDNFRAMDRETLKGYADEAQGALKVSREKAVASLREINTEVLNIVEGNLTEGFKTARAVLAAESVKEAIEIQREFIKSQFEAYAEQVKKIVELSRDRAGDTVEPIGDTAKSTWGKFKEAA